jgi:Mn-dependent DtxR family transcriptional regulator
MTGQRTGKRMQYELNPTEQKVLELVLHLSLAGRSVDSRSLAMCLSLPPERLQEAIGSLNRAGLVQLEPEVF